MNKMILKTLISFIILIGVLNLNAEEYHNPVDGKTYVSDWKTYTPDKPRTEREMQERVLNSGITLLTTEEDIDKNLNVNQIVKYIKDIENQANTSVRGLESNGVIFLQVSLDFNAKPEYKMSFQGDISQKYLQTFYNSLQELEFPNVLESNVSFIIEFNVTKA